MSKIIVLCRPGEDAVTTGIRTFLGELHKTRMADLLFLSRNAEPTRLVHHPVEKDHDHYQGTLIANLIYETDDTSVIKDSPHPRILYLHTYNSLKHGNERFVLEDVDVICYDRPLLAKHFIDAHPGWNKPYRELTLPFAFQQIRLPEIKVEKTVVVHARVASEKMSHLICETAGEMPDFQFVCLVPPGTLDVTNDPYIADFLERARALSNLSVGAGTSASLHQELGRSMFYMGLSEDPTGHMTYGVEYAAMEAMLHGCIPLINEGMEFEYRRQGAKACFINVSRSISMNIRNINSSLDFNRQRIVQDNFQFIQRKNPRFRRQLESIIEEFKP